MKTIESAAKKNCLICLCRCEMWLDKLDEEQSRKDQWIIVFNRIGMVLLIVFQLLNTISLVVVFDHA
jgi:hypothetical protein